MSEFGKRTTNARRSSPRQHFASGAPRPQAPTVLNLITRRELAELEKGKLPLWTTMSRMKLAGFALLMLAMFLGAVAFYGPEVARDLKYAGTYTVAYDLRASDGHCKRYMFLVTMCSAKIRSIVNNEPARSSEFLMFFRSGDGAELVPVRSTANASAVGIQYAVRDVLVNRTLSLLGIALFLGWICWLFADGLRKGRYQNGPAHEQVLDYIASRLNSVPAATDARVPA